MNDRKVRGLSGATVLTFVVFLFIILWLTNQLDQKDEEITWKDFEELVVSKDTGKMRLKDLMEKSGICMCRMSMRSRSI